MSSTHLQVDGSEVFPGPFDGRAEQNACLGVFWHGNITLRTVATDTQL